MLRHSAITKLSPFFVPGFPWRQRPSLSWHFAQCRGREEAGGAAGRRGRPGGVAGQLFEHLVPAAEAPSALRPWRWPLARRSLPQVWIAETPHWMKKERADADQFVKSDTLFPKNEILNTPCAARPLSRKYFYFNSHFAAVSARISCHNFADLADIAPSSL